MATIMPTLLPFGTIILISLPFFVAVTAVIVYANKHIKKVGDIVEDKEDEDAQPMGHQDRMVVMSVSEVMVVMVLTVNLD